MDRVMNHHLTFGGSYNSLVFNANDVVNRTPNASIKIPSTKYKIKKFMQPIYELQIHIKCKQCINYIKSVTANTQCDLCQAPVKSIDSDYFHYIPIKQQIMQNIKVYFADIMAHYSSATSTQNEITDIQSAENFKNAQKMYPKHMILPLIVNTDGVKVYRSISNSLWLIQAYQGYLPPSKRYLMSNILIIAAHFGKTISMSDFFYPFLYEMRQIADNGGITFKNNGKNHHFMPLIIGACCDIPATEHLRETAGFAGHFACGYCVHPGISVKRDAKSKPYIRYVKGEHKNRTHNDFIETYNQLKLSPICGIKAISCMVSAYSFDLVHSFSIDHMHCAELGIMKKLLSLWLDSSNHNEPYYIHKKHQVILNRNLISLKPVSEISRAPRSIFLKGEFKANELRNLMLFYLRFALPGVFESNNGIIINSNTSTKCMTHQLVWKYVMKHSLEINDSEKGPEILLGKKTIDCQLIRELIKETGIKIDNFNDVTIYTDFTLHGTKFKSRESKETAKIDYVVETKFGNLASVHFYMAFDSILYAVTENYEVVSTYDHFFEIKRTFTKNIIHASEIKKKCIFFKYGIREFVTNFPNKFEKT